MSIDSSEKETEVFRNPDGYAFAVEEARASLSHLYQSIAVKKDFARSIFSTASLISGLIAGLQLYHSSSSNSAATTPAPEWLLWVYGLAAAFYVLLLIFCLLVLKPVEVSIPFEPTYPNFYNAFLSKRTETEMNEQILVNYFLAMELTEPITRAQTRRVNLAAILLALLILLLFGANFYLFVR